MKLIIPTVVLLVLTSCAGKVEPPEPELELAPLVRVENFIDIDHGTITMGNMTINALQTVEGSRFLKKHRRTIQRLEDRLNAYYHKAVRRVTYLRLNNPLDTPIIITDVFKELGDPIDVFYSDGLRRPFDLDLGRKAIHMSLNSYVIKLIRALEEKEEELHFKLWREANPESTSD